MDANDIRCGELKMKPGVTHEELDEARKRRGTKHSTLTHGDLEKSRKEKMKMENRIGKNETYKTLCADLKNTKKAIQAHEGKLKTMRANEVKDKERLLQREQVYNVALQTADTEAAELQKLKKAVDELTLEIKRDADIQEGIVKEILGPLWGKEEATKVSLRALIKTLMERHKIDMEFVVGNGLFETFMLENNNFREYVSAIVKEHGLAPLREDDMRITLEWSFKFNEYLQSVGIKAPNHIMRYSSEATRKQYESKIKQLDRAIDSFKEAPKPGLVEKLFHK